MIWVRGKPIVVVAEMIAVPVPVAVLYTKWWHRQLWKHLPYCAMATWLVHRSTSTPVVVHTCVRAEFQSCKAAKQWRRRFLRPRDWCALFGTAQLATRLVRTIWELVLRNWPRDCKQWRRWFLRGLRVLRNWPRDWCALFGTAQLATRLVRTIWVLRNWPPDCKQWHRWFLRGLRVLRNWPRDWCALFGTA
jgi:hypothetical protein